MNTTIKTLAFLSISSFVFMGGCVQKLSTITFDHSTEQVIETNAVASTGSHTFGESVLTSTLKKDLESKNTSVDLLDELKLKNAKITVEDSASTLDNVEKVELWIQADGQPEVLLASKSSIPDGQYSVDLDVNSSENLVNYLKATTFTYRVKGTNSGPLPALKLRVAGSYQGKASLK